MKKISVVVDKSPMWGPVVERMRQKQSQLPDVKFVNWDIIDTFVGFKEKIIRYQTSTDALGLLGIFHFRDAKGQNVPYQQVLSWIAKNSGLPDFSYWEDRVRYGTLCAVTVSGYEQGLSAGKIAKGILVEGKNPSHYPMVPTVRGQPVVSLARAKKLGLKIKSDILPASEVITKFEY